MIGKGIQKLAETMSHVVTQPREELSRWQGWVRYAYELGVHGWRALRRDNAPQMAAALSFRTLFALLPVIVVSTLLVRAVRGEDGFRDLIQQVLLAVGAYGIDFGADDNGNPLTLGEWLDAIIAQASALNLAALGWVGLAIVAYSAIGLLVTIENSFNAVYGAPAGRSWTRRIPTYWLLLTLSPVMIGITLYLDNRLGNIIDGMHAWKWLLAFAKLSWGFVVWWLLMAVMFRLVPNTRVLARSALAGGFVAAVLLTIGKGSLGAYFEHAVSFKSLYGQLGLIPVFMFWMYLMWLAVLFGLEVSATVQRVQTMEVDELRGLKQKQPQTGLLDPASMLSVMELVSERFVAGKPVTMREIADEIALPESIVNSMIERLVREGFVYRVEGQEGGISLARVPDQITAERLIEIGYELVDEGNSGRQSSLVQRLRDAQMALARQTTMASLIQSRPVATPASQV